jgi:hypothetical protein
VDRIAKKTDMDVCTRTTGNEYEYNFESDLSFDTLQQRYDRHLRRVQKIHLA